MDTEFANEVNELIKAENPNAKNVTLAQIKKHLDNIHADEWHHTSKFGNQTNYYSAQTIADYFSNDHAEPMREDAAKQAYNAIVSIYDRHNKAQSSYYDERTGAKHEYFIDFHDSANPDDWTIDEYVNSQKTAAPVNFDSLPQDVQRHIGVRYAVSENSNTIRKVFENEKTKAATVGYSVFDTFNVSPEDVEKYMENGLQGESNEQMATETEIAQQYDLINGTELSRLVEYFKRGKILNEGESRFFHIGHTGELLQKYGMNGIITASTSTYSNRHSTDNHNLSICDWIKIIQSINSPIAIFQYHSNNNLYPLVLTPPLSLPVLFSSLVSLDITFYSIHHFIDTFYALV